MVDADLNPQVVSRVREAADIVEVVGEHVKLRRAGRRWQGLCPFHEEKTPSFSVNPERGLYYCFGCHAGGDVIDFVMRLDRLAFPEAVERLARRFGVSLPPRSPGARRRQEEVDRLRGLLEEAQHWFAAQLLAPAGKHARDELERRGFGRETWTEFGFGHAPDEWRALLPHLLRRHTEGSVVAAGLAVKRDQGTGAYDRFRGRVTFPIRAADGRLVAFGGRILGDGEPKYLNSPESPVFSKRTTLFNLDRSRRHIADSGTALVVEGYFDCLSLYRAEVRNAVATLGTALTSDHARILRRLAGRVLLCYDADAAGRRAAVAGARVLLEAGVEVAVLVMPPGQDPDDVVRQRGRDAFLELLQRPTTLLDFLLAQLPQDPVRRRQAGVRIAEIVGSARDRVMRYSLMEELARRLDLPLEVIEERARAGLGSPQQQATPVQQPPLPSGEALLARILVEAQPEQRQRISAVVDPDLLRDERVRRLVQLAQLSCAENSALRFESWRDDRELSAMVADLSNRLLPDITDETVKDQLKVVVEQQAREKARRLRTQIEEAERSGDNDRLASLLQEKLRLRRGVSFE